MATKATTLRKDQTYTAELRRGFVGIMPLWTGAAPFAVAFAITARTGGFSPLETQALSMLVFAGAAQVATVTLFAGGAGVIAITLTAFFLNLRHVLYGLSLNRQIPDRSRPGRQVLAFFLTDETYGVATRDHLDGRGGDAFYFGAALSLYVVFALSTLAGIVLGGFLPDPERIGLDFIFPLLFVALLVPLVRSRRQVLIAGVAAAVALATSQFAGGGTTILVATIAAAMLGAWIEGE